MSKNFDSTHWISLRDFPNQDRIDQLTSKESNTYLDNACLARLQNIV